MKGDFIWFCSRLIVTLLKLLALDKANKNKFYLHLFSLNRNFTEVTCARQIKLKQVLFAFVLA